VAGGTEVTPTGFGGVGDGEGVEPPATPAASP